MQPEDTQPDQPAQPYEPPKVEDVTSGELPSVTAAGSTVPS